MISRAHLSNMRWIAFFLCIPLFSALAQESKPLSVEWMYSPEAAEAASTPTFKWLDNGIVCALRPAEAACRAHAGDPRPGKRNAHAVGQCRQSPFQLEAIAGRSRPREPFRSRLILTVTEAGLSTFSTRMFFFSKRTRPFSRVSPARRRKKSAPPFLQMARRSPSSARTTFSHMTFADNGRHA